MFGRFIGAWKPLPGIPIWQGEDNLAGKRILVNRDGGFGDGIMFARWLPELSRRGAFGVGYRVWDSMAPLLNQALGNRPDIVAFAETLGFPHPDAKFDLQCALMSLPALLGMKSLADVPEGIRITPPKNPLCGMREGIDYPPLEHFSIARPVERRIGICWHAEESGVARKHRSVPEIALAPLKDIPGVRWYSLCPHRKDLYRHGAFTTPEWMTDLTAEFKDWSNTAAFMANLNLIITADTAVAHLAGAMGLPTWVLAPMRSDWKLLIGREDSPFYPSWRLFRQADPLSWEATIARVAEELRKL